MLDVALSLTAGQLIYDTHIAAIQLRRTQLPALDRLVAILPNGVRIDAEPGDDVTLMLDGGDSDATVFTGRLTDITRSGTGVRLVATNGGARLAAYRPALSLQSLSAGDAIRTLADEAGVDVDIEDDGPDLALYALDGRMTAAQLIADLTRLSGQGAAFDGDGTLAINAAGGSTERLALKYGREIQALEMTQGDTDGPTLHVVGEGGPAPSSAKGRLVAADFDRGDAGEAGFDNRRIALPAIRTTDAARQASGALELARRRRAAKVQLTTFLLPQLAPGMELEFAEMPDHLPLAGMRVQEVVHSVRPGSGAVSVARGTGETGTDPLAFLGDLVGAIGALL
jgi:hypothetical protein